MNRGDPGYEAGIGRAAGRRKGARNQPVEARRRAARTTNDKRVHCPHCELVGSPATIGRHLKYRHTGEPADCECGWRKATGRGYSLAWHRANRCPLRRGRAETFWCALCNELVGPLHDDKVHARDTSNPLACPHAGCAYVAADVADRNKHVLHECEERVR